MKLVTPPPAGAVPGCGYPSCPSSATGIVSVIYDQRRYRADWWMSLCDPHTAAALPTHRGRG